MRKPPEVKEQDSEAQSDQILNLKEKHSGPDFVFDSGHSAIFSCSNHNECNNDFLVNVIPLLLAVPLHTFFKFKLGK